MQRLLFEYHPLWTFICLLLGLGYAFILYRQKAVWGKLTNRLLFLLRTITVFVISLLLIGPILKLTSTIPEKPAFVFLIDNSGSIREAVDSTQREQLLSNVEQQASRIKDTGYEVEIRGLDGQSEIQFNYPHSDLQQSLRKVLADYEGRNLAGVVLVSDGIYNAGTSPLYNSLRLPVHTIGVGDTTERLDLALKNITYNKIAYQGNRFPVHADVQLKGVTQQDLTVSIYQSGKLIATQQKNSGTSSLASFDFLLDARVTGLQRFDLQVNPLSRESNLKNNRASLFLEVVEGKKKILLVAPGPHPDVKALRSAIEKNANYEVILHMPGVTQLESSTLQPEKSDLAVFFHAPDVDGKATSLLQTFLKSRTSVLLLLGTKSNLRQLEPNGIPFTFENTSQKDEVTPVLNPTFNDFIFADDLASTLASYPPVSVPFGKFTFPAEARVLLYQKIGSVSTTRPLLLSWATEDKKMAALLGEGIWRWRLSEFANSENTVHFDELFSKLIQYLSTQEDKRKFRSFPVTNEFTDAESVTFESQVYNDLYEPIYGNTVGLEIRDEQGGRTPYSYTLSPSASRFRLGSLKEGVYQYRASTELNGKQEEVRGEFLVTEQNLESQNLTADFGLLRKLSENTGGTFHTASQLSELGDLLSRTEARSILHSEDSFHPVINLKAIFFLVLLLISAEWFLRKYLGSY